MDPFFEKVSPQQTDGTSHHQSGPIVILPYQGLNSRVLGPSRFFFRILDTHVPPRETVGPIMDLSFRVVPKPRMRLVLFFSALWFCPPFSETLAV